VQNRLGGDARGDIHVHWHVTWQAGGANSICNTETPEVLHRARIAALHLREVRRPILRLGDDAVDATPTERDRQSQSHRARADDENRGFFRRH
jgi:hypothetical protein